MILILNCGSQSIKWKLFSNKLNLIKENKISVKDPKKYRIFLSSELKRIKEVGDNLLFVGHRVVHGGEKLREPVKINKRILSELEKCKVLAPLHNPFNVLGIKTAQKIFSKIDQFAVFDTEFFKDLPDKAKIYALPERLRKKYKIFRYGFHGTSHEYVVRKAAKIVKKPFSKLKMISCHLGGGASVCAIEKGKAVDASMGFTPLEGLVMMTRSGNLDPGIILFLSQKTQRRKKAGQLPIESQKLNEILNQESGIKGICGMADMKEVLKAAKQGSKKAKLALDVFVYSIQKYIGAYFAVLGEVDILIFTGAIGYGSAKIRKMICRNLKILTKTKILAIETNEELLIAEKIRNVVARK